MKIGIIGAGNMGGAIARGLVKSGEVTASQLMICSPNNKSELDKLSEEFDGINVSKDNVKAVDSDFIVIAVKPWLLKQVIDQIKPYFNAEKQTIVSVVAGVSFKEITEMLDNKENLKLVRLIPNTAISVGQSMTFIAGNDNAKEEAATMERLFNTMGKAMLVDEALIGAGTALASCGIAYALRYVRAASEGGVELGFYADKAKEVVMQTMLGAVTLLEHSKANPETEIDKVTTPGGITIKGLNAMEKNGFTNSVIEGLKASKK